MHDANEVLAPRLGLPRLPVVDWPEPSENDDADGRGRPFAWIDDEISEIDRDWVSGHHAGQTLLHRVDPRRGLTGADYRELGEWLRESRHS
ncbi:hypothetical protein CVV72_12280 [Amycolatopsis sp. TNS106]|nr:hypothetical protein CVV72_12280 [Amycolatopsis sp. TNS106]